MSLRRTAALKVKDGVVATYVHNQATPGMGKIGVLVALKFTGDQREAERNRPSGGDACRRNQSACLEG